MCLGVPVIFGIKDLKNLCSLSALNSDNEINSTLVGDIKSILSFISALESVNTEGVKEFCGFELGACPMRKDDESKSENCIKTILANAPEKKKDSFCVP